MIMKHLVSALVFSGMAFAQSIGDSVPACAAPCLDSGITSATSCSTTDAACQCTVENYRAIYTAALTCVLNGCGADVAIGQVLPAAEKFCLDAVGPISAPPVDATTPSAPSSPATTSTPAAPSPATTTSSAIGSAAVTPEGSFATTEAASSAAESSPSAAEFSGLARPVEMGSWAAMGAAVVALLI